MIVEDMASVQPVAEANLDMFIDVNPGMNRTGIGMGQERDIAALAQAIEQTRATPGAFRGLHFYDGHSTLFEAHERVQAMHKLYVVTRQHPAPSTQHAMLADTSAALVCLLDLQLRCLAGVDGNCGAAGASERVGYCWDTQLAGCAEPCRP